MATPEFIKGRAERLADALIDGGKWEDQDFAGAQMVGLTLLVGRGPNRFVLLRPLDAAALVRRLGEFGRELHLMEPQAFLSREDSLTVVLNQVEADRRER